ncbi:MAG TPA: glycosyltransferase [Candidatus Dojkabacteria bacterium]|nr:glycosyltransferase [Candidatus Dojkabacteria bacterium]
MKISLVIPTYKKQTEVLDQLERLYGYLSRKNPDFELIFVIDGYVDNTKYILQEYIKQNRLKKAYVIGYKQNKGKGYAVRYGMKKASGDVIGYIDADTDIQIRTLGYAIKEIKKPSVMAVIPSKFHKDSNINMTLKRRILSYGLIHLNRLLLVIPQNVTDIGCGLKLFKKDLIKRLLPNLKINGFAIDSEILNEIGKIGYQVSVIPFFLNINRSSSTSANISQTTAILRDIFNIAIHNRVEANTTAQILEYNN